MTRQRQLVCSVMVLGLSFAGLAASAPPTLADITGGALNIIATNSEGDAASVQIAVPAGVTSFTWSSNQPIELRSPTTGALIAVVNPQGRESRVEYVDDPIVNLTFSVLAGPFPINVSIASALLSFAPLVADGRATAGISLTDGDGDGATLTGIGDPLGSQGSYLAQYNGYAGTISGTTFAEVLPALAAGAFSTATLSQSVPAGPGFTPIGPLVSDMSVFISFTLTANDLASGTSSYVLVPRPVPTEPTTWSRIKAQY